MTPFPQPGSQQQQLQDTFAAGIQALQPRHRLYRVAVRRFLAHLRSDFPDVVHLSDLRRDPHLLGWIRSFSQQDPPLANDTRRIYLTVLRRLLQQIASQGFSVAPGLILPEDFPSRPSQRPRVPQKDRSFQQQPRPLNNPRLRPHPIFQEIFDTAIQALATILQPETINGYRVAARGFLFHLQTNFPQLFQLSDLRRDPHVLGWIHGLCEQTPELSDGTREQYLYKLQRLLRDLAFAGHPLQPNLILPEDLPPRRRGQQNGHIKPHLSDLRFGEIFQTHIQTLATTLRLGTIASYRATVRSFLCYLQTDFPQLLQLCELRRDPHLFGWFRRLCEQDPPLSNATRQDRLLNLRRLFHDLAFAGHPLQPDLILTEDLPPRPQYLPRALSPEDDQRIQQELRRTDDLLSNALLLTRATGMRIGECIHLALNCLRSVGQDQWSLHVPLGKLYTERLVPVDENTRQIVTRILALRAEAPPSWLAQSAGFLLPRSGDFATLYQSLRLTLHQAAQRVGCSDRVTPHRLRHTYATEMIRLGVSLPVLMQLLGHKNIRMTLRYVQVTQRDLQREFHLARQNAPQNHFVPDLFTVPTMTSDLPGVRRALEEARHLLEMYRRRLQDEKSRHKVRRLDKRLLRVAFELDHFTTAEK
jgi:site-specific recombinase XerD